MDEKEAEARPLMGTIFLVSVSWTLPCYDKGHVLYMC